MAGKAVWSLVNTCHTWAPRDEQLIISTIQIGVIYLLPLLCHCNCMLCIFNSTRMILKFSWSSPHMLLTLSSTSWLVALHAWFTRRNGLHSNKSEAIRYISTPIAFPSIRSVTIAGSQVPSSQTTAVLGDTLDSMLSLNRHTSSTLQSIYFPYLLKI